MSKAEESLARIWDNVAKLDFQIASLLKGLIQDNILEESSMTPILAQNKPCKSEEPKSENIAVKNKNTSTLKKSGASALSSKKKATSVASIDTSTEMLTKKISLESGSGEMKTNVIRKKSVFTTENTESFLVPVMDKWVFGITLINTSKISQKLPGVIVSLVNRNGNILRQPFIYNYKSRLLNVDKDHFWDNPSILPVGEALTTETDQDLPSLGTQMVKSGSKFATSVSFSHPMHFTNDPEDDLSILVSLDSDGKTIWSKSFGTKTLDFSPNESTWVKFCDSIFIAMSQFYQTFKMELISSGYWDFYEHIDDFLQKKLQLNEVQTVKTRFDTQTRTYCTKNLTFFWGFVLQLEYCNRNENMIRGTVFARNSDQFDSFQKLLLHWIQEQKKESQTIVVSYELLKKEDVIPDVVRKEMKTVVHFMHLNERRMVDERSDHVEEFRDNYVSSSGAPLMTKERVSLNWLKTYVNDMIFTDSIFMRDYDS